MRAKVADFLYALLRPCVRLLCRRPVRERRILLVAHNALTAEYLAEVWKILRPDQRLKFYSVVRAREESPGDRARAIGMLPGPLLSQRAATFRPWDAVILADHPGPFLRLANPQWHAVVRIPHGFSGKTKQGANYYYDPARIFDRQGRARYTRIFESSPVSRASAIAADPRLKDRIAIVGSPRLDLIDRTLRTSTPPLQTGLPIILVASSWGPNSLFIRLADELFNEAERLLNRYTVLVRPHPQLYVERCSGGRDWRAVLAALEKRGFMISLPENSLVMALAAAEVVVVDELSSVAPLAAAAGKRLVLFSSGQPAGTSAGVGADSIVDRLRRVVPTIVSVTDLEPALNRVSNDWPPPALAALLQEINGEPGRSAMRIRAEMNQLLDLAEEKP